MRAKGGGEGAAAHLMLRGYLLAHAVALAAHFACTPGTAIPTAVHAVSRRQVNAAGAAASWAYATARTAPTHMGKAAKTVAATAGESCCLQRAPAVRLAHHQRARAVQVGLHAAQRQPRETCEDNAATPKRRQGDGAAKHPQSRMVSLFVSTAKRR